jgi:hypothetical protein
MPTFGTKPIHIAKDIALEAGLRLAAEIMLFGMMSKRPVDDLQQLRSRCPDAARFPCRLPVYFSISATAHSKIQAHRSSAQSSVGRMGKPADSLAIRSGKASLNMLLIGIRLS